MRDLICIHRTSTHIQTHKHTHTRKVMGPKRSGSSFDERTFNLIIDSKQAREEAVSQLAKAVDDILTEACNATMSKRSIESKRGNLCYWWSKEIHSFRKDCLEFRGKVERSRSWSDFESKFHLGSNWARIVSARNRVGYVPYISKKIISWAYVCY